MSRKVLGMMFIPTYVAIVIVLNLFVSELDAALCYGLGLAIFITIAQMELVQAKRRKALYKLRYVAIDCYMAYEEVKRLSYKINNLDLEIEQLLLIYDDNEETIQKLDEKRSERISLANEKTTLIQKARHRELTEEESKSLKHDFTDCGIDSFVYCSRNDYKLVEGIGFYKRVCGI